MEEIIRLMIVDDHPLIRQALIRTIHGSTDIQVVGEAENGYEAVEKSLTLAPDVIIMDLSLPGKSGIEAISEIMQRQPQIRILVISGKDDPATITKAIQAGAIGFLGKGDDDNDILNAIRETNRGMTTMKGSVIRNLIRPAPVLSLQEKIKELLSERELEVLQHIAAGCSDQEISAIMTLADSTVRSHVNHILSKLGLESRTALIRQLVKCNIKLNDPGAG